MSLAAAEQKTETQAQFTALTATCAILGHELTLRVIFDNELEREKLLVVLNSALTRAGLGVDDCDKGSEQQINDPDDIIADAAPTTRVFTLAVFAGNLPDDGGAIAPIYSYRFAETSPKITIADNGKWVFRPSTMQPSLLDAPLSLSYDHPKRFLACESGSHQTMTSIEARYLVQVVHFRCDGAADTGRDLFFFGLGSFAARNQSYETDSAIIVMDAAYLALEFELHRAAVERLK